MDSIGLVGLDSRSRQRWSLRTVQVPDVHVWFPDLVITLTVAWWKGWMPQVIVSQIRSTMFYVAIRYLLIPVPWNSDRHWRNRWRTRSYCRSRQAWCTSSGPGWRSQGGPGWAMMVIVWNLRQCWPRLVLEMTMTSNISIRMIVVLTMTGPSVGGKSILL